MGERMSDVSVRALLALWNDIESTDVQPEYESWHSFEHVPERVGLPDFVEAMRYRSVTQPLRYFTCYRLRSLQALHSPEYGDVFTHPTPWSVRMRLVLRNFYRMPCELGGLHGVSTAGQLATLQWRSTDPGLQDPLNDRLQHLVLTGMLIRAEWGVEQMTEAYWLPNTANRLQGPGQNYVLLLQHMDRDTLHESSQALFTFLQSHASSVIAPEYFEQLTHVRQDALTHSPRVRQEPLTTLFNQFTKR